MEYEHLQLFQSITYFVPAWLVVAHCAESVVVKRQPIARMYVRTYIHTHTYEVLHRHCRVYGVPLTRESQLVVIHEIVGENLMINSIYYNFLQNSPSYV